jgi:hypothetical protein
VSLACVQPTPRRLSHRRPELALAKCRLLAGGNGEKRLIGLALGAGDDKAGAARIRERS